MMIMLAKESVFLKRFSGATKDIKIMHHATHTVNDQCN